MHIIELAQVSSQTTVLGRELNWSMPSAFRPLSILGSNVEEWEPSLKHYPHFDKPIPKRKIKAIVTSPERVAQHPFFPFLRFTQEFRRFGRKPKKRPIRYAGRCDAYIFAYYRHLLSEKYEQRLKKLDIQECPTAYRKIPVEEGKESGKCNIHFAKEAFATIKDFGDCYAIVLEPV